MRISDWSSDVCSSDLFDDFVQVADGAAAYGCGQRTVVPHGFVVPDQEASDQVAGAKVVVAGYGDKRSAQAPCHVFDEAGFAATGGDFQHAGQPVAVALVKPGYLFGPERKSVGEGK